MKGIVFTVFLDFVAETHDHDMVDDIIDDAALQSGGAYTAIGTYPSAEIVALITALAQRTGAKVPDILHRFGGFLGDSFQQGYPQYFEKCPTLFDFLCSVDGYIHIEVLKLYPDAELPSFAVVHRDAQSVQLDYRSVRCMEALAEGLIQSAARYYKQPVRVEQQLLDAGGERVVRFTIAAH